MTLVYRLHYTFSETVLIAVDVSKIKTERSPR
jgi:hypothetical protein